MIRLEVENLYAGYGMTTIVRDVSFDLQKGEALAVVGRNGMGKTTLLRGILGYLNNRSGFVRLDNQDVMGWPTYRIIRRGIAFSPQEHALFGDLSVEENLDGGTLRGRLPNTRRAEILDYFPILGQRLRQRAGTLSGGEQKMLIMARALLAEPHLLIIDEISDGLQPAMVSRVSSLLQREREQRGVTILMVEQNLDLCLSVADRVAVMKLGQLVLECPARVEQRLQLEEELAL